MRPELGLLERDQAIARLLAAAREDESSVALITGEAGIGKTSVVRALLDRIPPGVRAFAGACDDLLAPPALGPIREAFRGSGSAAAEALASGAMDATFEAVTAALSGSQLQVLVIEDVHWADDVTIDVLRYLVRRLDRIRVLLVLTYRPDAVDSRASLRALLGDLRGDRIIRIELSPLSLTAVTALAAGSAHNADELHSLTKGNPFYLTETLAGPAGDIPVTVVDAVLARVGSLSDQCLPLVEQLSVIPTQLRLDFAERLLGKDFEQLAEAEQRGVLVLQSAGVGFRHEIARRATEQQLPEIRRRSLNATVVSVLLQEEQPDLSRLIHHAAQARDVDTLVAYAPQAARASSAAGSHQEAVATFETVTPYADRLPPDERAAFLDDYAWELHIAHRLSDAVQVGEEAIKLREQAGEPAALAETLLRVSRSQYLSGDTKHAITGIERAGRLAESADSKEVLASISAYRGMTVTQARQGHAIEELQRARQLALEVGRTDLAALCLNYLGVTYSYMGNPEGLRLIHDSLESALASGDDESAARGYTSLAAVLYREGRFAELAECLDAGLEFTREHGIWAHSYDLEVHQAQLDLRLGRWDTAETRLRRLVASSDDPGMFAVYSRPVLARLMLRQDESVEAEDMLAASWKRAWAQESLIGVLYAGVGGAEWTWLSGRRDVAEQLYKTATEQSIPVGLGFIVGEFYYYLWRAGLDIEPFEGCAEVYAAAMRGDWERAVALTEDPYEQALFKAGSDDVEATTQAIWALDELGARPAARLARAELAKLGVKRLPRRPAAATRSNPAGLTARQVDVLRLLAAGRSNNEIAAELVLSVRTVDHHVSAILLKLGVPTRRQAASTAASLGLV
ncbi:ATP-binding protein [Kribbella qitaiheensis]|uniref:ATP-binding protein n=1 Tax=Kribbella qitaiheensis TaxID=1544730 RepID=UPI00360625FE